MNKLSIVKLLTLATILVSGAASAQIAGKTVIGVHGYDADHFANPSLTNAEVVQINNELFEGTTFPSIIDVLISWDSSKRIQEDTAERVKQQVIELAQNNTCIDGCIFLSVSAGDLVTRMLLNRQEAWLEPLGLEPLNILFTIDLVGAGGGSNVNDVTYDIVGKNDLFSLFLKTVLINPMFPTFTVNKQEDLGSGIDLRIRNARSIPNTKAVPRLRFSATGSEFSTPEATVLFKLFSQFLKGDDDGVIALHSSCGALIADEYVSCNKNIKPNGQLTSIKKAPIEFMNYHYPVVMTADLSHQTVALDVKGSPIVAIPDIYSGAFNVETQKETETIFFFWKKEFLTIKGSENLNMVELIASSFN